MLANPQHEAPREDWKCPECGCTQLIRDGATGEVVCRRCGLVVREFETVPRYTPKNVNRGCFAVVNLLGSGKPTPSELRMGGRYLSLVGRQEDKTVLGVASDIEKIADRIFAPKPVRETAMLFAKKLIKAMREKNRKLRTSEIAAVSLFCACRQTEFIVTFDEYESIVKQYTNALQSQSLLKLLNKADGIARLPREIVDVKNYIMKLAAKLEGHMQPRLVSAVTSYAITIYEAAADDVSGKDPVCTAATALCVADEIMGGAIGRKRILELTGARFSQSAAMAMKRLAPFPRDRLLNDYVDFMEWKFAKVTAYEDAGNAAR